MNLFFLDDGEAANAQAHCDQHIIKMPLEVAQMLYTTLYILSGKDKACYAKIISSAPLTRSAAQRGYKPTHVHHPVVTYAAKNFLRVVNYGLSLCKEYSYRFGKKHAVKIHLEWLKSNIPTAAKTASLAVVEPPPSGDQARTIYREKASTTFKRPMRYTKRQPPHWLQLEIERTAKKNGDILYKITR